MTKDVSKKTVIILLIITILVAVSGTLLVLNQLNNKPVLQLSDQESSTEGIPDTVGLVKVEILERPEDNGTNPSIESDGVDGVNNG